MISVSPKESQKLNGLYRGKDKATNVLSFRYDSEYGEVLVCPSVIQKEAREQNNSYEYQMTWMVVHGIIHLAEIHHEASELAAQHVDRLEKQVLNKFFGKSQNSKGKSQKFRAKVKK